METEAFAHRAKGALGTSRDRAAGPFAVAARPLEARNIWRSDPF